MSNFEQPYKTNVKSMIDQSIETNFSTKICLMVQVVTIKTTIQYSVFSTKIYVFEINLTFISLKINLFSPSYSCKNCWVAVKQ